jgi:hypothetical protein
MVRKTMKVLSPLSGFTMLKIIVCVICLIIIFELFSQKKAMLFAWTGPCVVGGKCGGLGGGGDCYFDANTGGCEGSCVPYCPGGSSDIFCSRVSGPCTMGAGTCSRIQTFACTQIAAGCICLSDGGYAGWCPHLTCENK